LQSIDLSGVMITPEGGRALADGIMSGNTTLRHLELEGVFDNYKDEFNIPELHKKSDWMIDLDYQLRLNRAFVEGKGLESSPRKFVDAISHVSDHVGCIYYLLRTHHKYTSRLALHHT
jgi:hypothetical protein